MSFKYIRSVTDEEEKYLSVASQLNTFNDKPIPSAEDVINLAINRLIDESITLVKSTNNIRRSEALKNADEATAAVVDAALGIEPVEGKK